MTGKTKPTAPVHFRCDYDIKHVQAIKALQRGDATAHQQKLALDWIVLAASRAHDVTFLAESSTASAFLEGRRFVGLQILKLLAATILHGDKENASS